MAEQAEQAGQAGQAEQKSGCSCCGGASKPAPAPEPASAAAPPPDPALDALNRRYQTAQTMARDGRGALERALGEFAAILPSVKDATSRGRLRRQIWEVERALGRRPFHFSQAGQDAFLDENLFRRRDGVFVEVGAYDGVTGSNTLFLEMMRGWSGFLVEPSPRLAQKARESRRSPVLQCAVAPEAGEGAFLDIREGFTQMGGLVASYDPQIRARVEADPRHQADVISVPMRTLPELLEERGLERVDYISLDVEGGEQAILESFPHGEIFVTSWTVENNSGTPDIARLMASHGYKRIEVLGVDEVYVRAGGTEAGSA